MKNIPELKMGIVAVSRDCFPISLSEQRCVNVCTACAEKSIQIYRAETIVENEKDVLRVIDQLKSENINALVLYLGNFGPEGPETLLIQKMGIPTMVVAAAEESDLIDGRGDAYCGMLNASYNLALRGLKAYIPEYPVGTAEQVADMIAEFEDIARVVVGLSSLKILSFGPRPHDFLACNAPIKPLYDLGVEIMENSELDLFEAFNKHQADSRIPAIVKEMENELGSGNTYPDILEKLAQYEITLLDWAEANKGASQHIAFANKCWPAFQTQFGFVPCYVNSRLAKRGIPVACETDIYGALTEYIITCAVASSKQTSATLLDINNTVPKDMIEENPAAFRGYKPSDLFMGFHCGNTASDCITDGKIAYQLIMKRNLEPDNQPNISRGTFEGNLMPGAATIFRLQSTAAGKLISYVAQGEVINVNPKSFGSIGIIAIKEMGRFYRHVLIGKRFPHHAGVAFTHKGKTLFAAMKYLGINDVCFNQPEGMLYEGENPFAN